MRLTYLLFILLFISEDVESQIAIDSLSFGPYNIGFEHHIAIDSSRKYQKLFKWTNTTGNREIPISLWYPGGKVASENKLRILDYMNIYKEEEDWEDLPESQILNWFKYENNERNREHLKRPTRACYNLEALAGDFPVIIYSPGYEGSSIENFRLFEYLASHGYIIIASPSRGTSSRFMENGIPRDIATQSLDIEFLITFIKGKLKDNGLRFYSIGHSFGGLANVYTQMKSGDFEGIINLDGSIKYQYEKMRNLPFFELGKYDVPFLNFSQKIIPEEVLRSENLDASINTNFEFLDDLNNIDLIDVRFHHLSHSYFTTLGVLFETRDKRQDHLESEISASYVLMCEYVEMMLEVLESSQENRIDIIAQRVVAAGEDAITIEAIKKDDGKKKVTFASFNDLLANDHYRNVDSIYNLVKHMDSEFVIDEWKLNNLGLQLMYSDEGYINGIKMLSFATTLFPKSANLYDSLGEAYLLGAEMRLAQSAFEKSLQLNPGNQNAINRLREISDH